MARKTPSQSGSERRRSSALLRIEPGLLAELRELAELRGDNAAAVADAIMRPVVAKQLAAARRKASRKAGT